MTTKARKFIPDFEFLYYVGRVSGQPNVPVEINEDTNEVPVLCQFSFIKGEPEWGLNAGLEFEFENWPRGYEKDCLTDWEVDDMIIAAHEALENGKSQSKAIRAFIKDNKV